MNKLVYKNNEHIIDEKQVGKVLYLSYSILEKTELVEQGFSTRIGGVSKGIYETMNLSYSRGDDEMAVRENYRRMADALGVSEESFVFSAQTHTTNVQKVTEANRKDKFQDIDGLITNVPGLCLVTSYADCVP